MCGGRETGAVVEANVNLKARTVTSVERLEGLFVPELTEAEKAKAINIALADPRVKEILDKGGRISKVFPSLWVCKYIRLFFYSTSGISASLCSETARHDKTLA